MIRRVRRKPDTADAPASGEQVDEATAFRALVERANRRDKTALRELHEALDRNPQLWRGLADLAAMVRSVVIKSLANGNVLLQESVQRKADELERELAGDNPSPLLSLAVKRFVATWLQLQHADAAAAAATKRNSLQQAKFWAQRQDQASRRYDRAMKTLMQLTKRDVRHQPTHDTSEDTSDNAGSDPSEVLLRMADRA